MDELVTEENGGVARVGESSERFEINQPLSADNTANLH